MTQAASIITGSVRPNFGHLMSDRDTVHTRDLAQPDEVAFGPFRLLVRERRLLRGDDAVQVGSRALDILIVLLEGAGQVVTKRELTRRVWADITVDESCLRVPIAALRKALADGRDGARYIANVTGRGYSFVGAITRPEQPTAAPPNLAHPNLAPVVDLASAWGFQPGCVQVTRPCLDREDAEMIADLYRKVDSLLLAIEAIAARVGVDDLASARLSAAFTRASAVAGVA
jgi:DNA-binding winged helix-turn-helix (wHTH) protein